MGQRVYAEVYGCSANQADGEIALGILKKKGHQVVDRPSEADYIVLVTCAVKKPTADRMIHRIRKFADRGSRLIVAGCMATGEADRVKHVAPMAVLLPPRNITEISSVIEKGIFNGGQIKLGYPRIRRNPVVSIIPVSEGCRWSRCSFCIVPKTRPGFESYPLRSIVEEVRESVNEGCKEIWLTSQDMGSYGLESGRNLLPELLESVNKVEGKFYVRVGMMNPIYLKPILRRLVESFKGEKIFKFLHLPVQSGSDKILNEMRRGHDVKLFKEIVSTFKDVFPELTLSTDVIVGYTSETEEDFEQTLKLLEEIRPSVVNVSKYFPRPGTLAQNLRPVSSQTVTKRIAELNAVLADIQVRNNQRWVGWCGEVLVDEVGKKGKMIGRNYAYRPVVFESEENLLGRFVEVEVVEAERTYLRGRLLGRSFG
ncbi:MAG: tRNA (N(6)-L-threonylcarbamoyladenosine(37)-C(2))-methylthiotransferase [Candidatus Caldarchaeum sp.]|nr:tRNA (N(6)-L-threonylcarbamoyladenosine(37)-C(2))-methylthiotransferase [Candidatus Caldarchaeum sp.]MCS7133204.1 tRNA (N(6)-L-threonylcarbamoyladenosine(37)-C(2))-methylthiotransferase [Candidatus Caldarchaeum sp.]MCX8201106.1 tRNA (N(6)-L-threonylcarbamoyladenosine(37)-C(2))-methylthiotransferase [Candidatus Caldarchaeum sp.]MDW8063062.1 tRNA (N(6)-L-threonylcarbamoyladenosine(37)-C(2))-methylthiotransferase [Candidatus Caldarchaeum sp.]MDW8434703.1 tRNA (N(6)-L-threonylcarbamoyladenosine(